jgi:hypothetical protein
MFFFDSKMDQSKSIKHLPRLELAVVREQRANEFHHAMAEWRAGYQTEEQRRTCTNLGEAYRSALDQEIETLEELDDDESSGEILMVLQYARAMRMILEEDLELIKNIH